MSTVDQAMNYMADKIDSPISYYGTVNYTTLSSSSGWKAPISGFGVLIIEPSNTSNGYAYIQDVTASINDVTKASSVSGIVNSAPLPIIKGHTYKIRSSTSNVRENNRCYIRYYTFLK